MGIKFRVFKFREDFRSRVYNFAISLQSRKNAKLNTREITYQQGKFRLNNDLAFS